MKTEQEIKHTPLPWFACDYGPFINIQDGPYYQDKNLLSANLDDMVTEEKIQANAAFILEACNNYYSLKEERDHWLNHAKEVAESNRKLQEEMKEDEHAMKILVAQVQQLQEENERLKLKAITDDRMYQQAMEAHIRKSENITKLDSEVKTLREALESIQDECFRHRHGECDDNSIAYITMKADKALQSKGGEQ